MKNLNSHCKLFLEFGPEIKKKKKKKKEKKKKKSIVGKSSD